MSLVSRSTVRLSSPAVVVLEQLDLELFGRLVEHALRALALLQDRLDRRPRADHHPHRRAEQHRAARRSSAGRSGRRRRSRAPCRRGGTARSRSAASDRPGIDRNSSWSIRNCVHVEELEAVALGQAAGLRFFRAALLRRDVAAAGSPLSATGSSRILGQLGLWHYAPITDVSSNSGRYSASTTTAITMPMMMSSTGSISVTKRPTSVSISSS